MTYTIPDFGPSDLMTSGREGKRRVRVDVAQTGFFEGREFLFSRKLTSPICYKLVTPVNIIVHAVALNVVDGDYEFFSWAAPLVTELTPFTDVSQYVIRKNAMTDTPAYTRQFSILSGGTISVSNTEMYGLYAHMKTANATAQQSTIGATASSEIGLPPGTYYFQFTGTASGSAGFWLEERQ